MYVYYCYTVYYKKKKKIEFKNFMKEINILTI